MPLESSPSTPSTQAPKSPPRYPLGATVCFLFWGMFPLLAVFAFILAPNTDNPFVTWLLLSGPLILMIPSMRSGTSRSAILLCFILTFYFCHAVIYGFLINTEQADLGVFGIIEGLWVSVLFISAFRNARRLQKQQNG